MQNTPGSRTTAPGSFTPPSPIRPHRLKENKGRSWPRRMVFWDTETSAVPISPTVTEHHLRLGWAAYWRNDLVVDDESALVWRSFTSHASVADTIEEFACQGETLYAVAHNLDFDLVVSGLLVSLPERGWRLVAAYTDPGAKVYRFRKARAQLVFVDSLNYFRGSLASLGERIGLDKLSVDFATVDDDTLSEYCRRDVLILYRTFREYRGFLSAGDYGNFAITAASQAFKAFTHRFLHHQVYIHDKEKAISLERSAYFGGRCEAFWIGSPGPGPFYKLDMNSLYPHIMAATPVPVKLVGYYSPLSMLELEVLSSAYYVIADVLVHTDTPHLPCRWQGRLVFPTGYFRTSLAGPELAAALFHDQVVEVYAASFYQQAVLFKEYVEHFYAKRLEFRQANDPILEYFCKVLLNSLYGKFGQARTEWVTVGEIDPREVYLMDCYEPGGVNYLERGLCGAQQRRYVLGNSYNTLVAIPVAITAAGRMLLWSLIQQAGRENVYYVDTDSLIVNGGGLARLAGKITVEPVLGGLRVEGESETLLIRGAKDYSFGDETKRKGIRRDAEQLAPSVYRQDQWLSLRGQVLRGTVDRALVLRIVKQISNRYTKGIVLDSGQVIPFVLSRASPAL